jgi:hypothetical protein
MPIQEAEPTEFKVKGLKVKSFFNEDFVRLIEEKLPNIKFEHSCFVILEKKEGEEKESVKERMMIAHDSRKDEAAEILSIGAHTPEIAQTLLEVIKEFFEKQETQE